LDTYCCERCTGEYAEDEYTDSEELGWGLLCPDCTLALKDDPAAARDWAKADGGSE